MLTFRCARVPTAWSKPDPTVRKRSPWTGRWTGSSRPGNSRGGHILGLALTGGEPFCIQITDPGGGIRQSARFLSSPVVTNAFWAKTEEDAIAVLSGLPDIKVDP